MSLQYQKSIKDLPGEWTKVSTEREPIMGVWEQSPMGISSLSWKPVAHLHTEDGAKSYGFKWYTRPCVQGRLLLAAITSTYLWSMGGRSPCPPMPWSFIDSNIKQGTIIHNDYMWHAAVIITINYHCSLSIISTRHSSTPTVRHCNVFVSVPSIDSNAADQTRSIKEQVERQRWQPSRTITHDNHRLLLLLIKIKISLLFKFHLQSLCS